MDKAAGHVADLELPKLRTEGALSHHTRAARRLSMAAILAGLLALAGLDSARAEPSVQGTYALPDGTPKVTAVLTAAPESGLRRTLDIAMTPLGGTNPIQQYDVELSKELHVIGVDSALRTFVHEHGDRPDPSGHFQVGISFPHPGLWHIFADAVPHRMGQQVLRFDLPVGSTPSSQAGPDLAPTGPVAADGRYAVRLESLQLKSGQQATIQLHLLRDGKPAPDVTPYLGVAAHAVFVAAADLSYVHVHAAPAATQSMSSAHMQGDMTGMAHEHGTSGMAASSGPMPMMEEMSPLAPGAHVEPDLVLHVTPPKPGDYVLWIQFMGDRRVRTVRFVIPAV